MSRSDEFSNGWIRAELRAELISSISIATGVLATLSLEHPSAWMSKLQTIHPEHLRILLKEIQAELRALETFVAMVPPSAPTTPPSPPRKPSLTLVSRV